MKNKILALLLAAAVLTALLGGCAEKPEQASPQILATTAPVWQMTESLLEGTGLTCGRLITESVSCLHEYTLSVSQMTLLEQAEVVIANGLSLEAFMDDQLRLAKDVVYAGQDVQALPGEDGEDPHIWLSPAHCITMCGTIAQALSARYPAQAGRIAQNLAACEEAYRAAQAYGEEQLAELSCRELVTFHDGFAYFADAFGLTVAASMEIESGSEPSARELAEVAELVRGHAIPVVFAEKNGDDSAARTVASETGAAVRLLDLGMGSDGISPAQVIRNNIDTVKEALG